MSASTLQFVPFTSSLDSAFWHVLSKKKLDEYGLSEDPIAVKGYFTNSNAAGVPCLMELDFSSFDVGSSPSPGRCEVEGQLLNTNTIDQFKTIDKNELLKKAGAKIWEPIMSGEALNQPHALNQFIILTFANLKKYQYHYWFGFGALARLEPITLSNPIGSIKQCLTDVQISEFFQQYDSDIKSQNIPYFAMRLVNDQLKIMKLSELSVDEEEFLDSTIFVFTDPSTHTNYPGWPLRNFLCLISRHFVTKAHSKVKIIALRDRTVSLQRDISNSLYIEVTLSPLSPGSEMWPVVGWEKNKQQKMLPKFVNLSKTMDPTKLAESAVDLNLKLMRWRLLPDLDLNKISETKCLLLGAGTLGCNVARNLLGWGVRNITLVDNSTVSYSNPVRQSLFVFDDCLAGGKQKAEAAAKSLQQIFPGVNAKGLSLNIPMPGHPVEVSSLESVRKDVSTLETLIEEHDAVFLLMDTRESRWLPSVIGAAKNKIVLTAALGFDTWLAMRHGSRHIDNTTTSEDKPSASSGGSNHFIAGTELGCYYCNDVVAPRNSTRDRTLDQQCTVSRPGLSMLCSALIVELLVSMIQHPLRSEAPAHLSTSDEDYNRTTSDEDTSEDDCILGIVPHQIRGYLSKYQIILPVSKRFTNCSACSDMVIKRYKEDGFEFLLQAFNDAQYLEVISGLQELHMDPLSMEVLSDFDDDEDDW